MAGFASFSCVLLISSVLLASYACASEVELDYSSIPIETGLSWDFHDSSCPKLESIIRKELKKIFKNDIGQAAGLLRVHFHDCFVQVTTPFWFWELYYLFTSRFSYDLYAILWVDLSSDLLLWFAILQGCDSSVLLDESASRPCKPEEQGEQCAPPNVFLRATAFEIIDDLRELVHKKCGRVVSCSDITALAARDSVFLVNSLPPYSLLKKSFTSHVKKKKKKIFY